MEDMSVKGILVVGFSLVFGGLGLYIGGVGGLKIADQLHQRFQKQDSPFVTEYSVKTIGYFTTLTTALITGGGVSVITYNLITHYR